MSKEQKKTIYVTDQIQFISTLLTSEELIMRRRNLPHWELGGAIYFITFRLAGTIPLAVINKMREDNELKIKKEIDRLGDISRDRMNELKFELLMKIDDYLDKNMKIRYLGNPQIAKMVQEALLHFAVLLVPDATAFKNNSNIIVFDGKKNETADIVLRYIIFSWVLMHNHAHILIQPMINPKTGKYFQLEKILHSIKSYTGTEANKILNRNGQFWQHESYDHIIRNEDEFYRIWKYIDFNPVKAGLCNREQEWKWGREYFATGL